jgi:hypothetical protein
LLTFSQNVLKKKNDKKIKKGKKGEGKKRPIFFPPLFLSIPFFSFLHSTLVALEKKEKEGERKE